MTEIKQRIAELLGWRVFSGYPHNPDDKSARVINPRGEEVHLECSDFDVDVNLGRAWNHVPDFENDDTALMDALDVLLQDKNVLHWDVGGTYKRGAQSIYTCCINRYGQLNIYESGETRKAAMLAALLKYLETAG